MAFRVVPQNVLETSRVVAWTGNPDFPDRYLYDGPGGMGARTQALLGDPTITIETTMTTNSATPAATATEVVGTIEDSSDQDHGSDAKSLKVLGDNAHIDYGTYTVRAGHLYGFEGWGYGSGTGPAAAIAVYNPNTKRWWNGTIWSDSIAYLVNNEDAAWEGFDTDTHLEIEIESSDEVLGPTTTIVIQLWRLGTDTADPVYFDDLHLYPGVDFCGFFGGHNFPPYLELEWKSATILGIKTSRAVFTKAPHQFWEILEALVFAPVHYIEFNHPATLPFKFYAGDLVMGQSIALAADREGSAPLVITEEERQTRLETAGGTRYIRSRGPYAPRRVSFTMKLITDAQFKAFRDALFVALRGGQQSAVLIPTESKEPQLAIYGDIQGSIDWNRPTPIDYREASIQIDEGAGFEIR